MTKFSDELRQYADYDSRSGAPLGIRMRKAADLIDELTKALNDVVQWHGKRSYASPEAPDVLIPADEQEREIAAGMRVLEKVGVPLW